MNCLVYCVLRRQEEGGVVSAPAGVDGVDVLLVSENDLCAAVSCLNPRECTPGRDRLMAYKRVIDFFHRDQTVIPMRYGCFLDDFSAVRRLLDDRRAEYAVLLDELAGCVEMGIRVLPGASAPEAGDRDPSPPLDHARPGRGHAYLEHRKAHYRRLELSEETRRRVIGQCRASFFGLFRRFSAEETSPGSPLVSLYFLVPRGLVDPFRERFRRLELRKSAKVLLSGPWPPYNFARPEGLKSAAGEQEKKNGVEGLWLQ